MLAQCAFLETIQELFLVLKTKLLKFGIQKTVLLLTPYKAIKIMLTQFASLQTVQELFLVLVTRMQ